jgi:isocitrate lyase
LGLVFSIIEDENMRDDNIQLVLNAKKGTGKKNDRASALDNTWTHARRWEGIHRPYSVHDVLRLAGTVQPECTLARLGAERLWRLLHDELYVKALGASTGNQALQQVKAGLNAIYVSGWQVAADASGTGDICPDRPLNQGESVPTIVRRINDALLRADQIQHANGEDSINCFAPIVADAETGFGGALNTFELMKDMIEAGAAAVHFEDQSFPLKKDGYKNGKVIIPAKEFIAKLAAARLASDILGIPTILIGRTDAQAARFIQSDIDPIDQPFLTEERTIEGYFGVKGGLQYAITRALEFAPYVDMLWYGTSTPDLGEAREFAEALHSRFPKKLLAYNCSPSLNWKTHLTKRDILSFQDQLGLMGYKFQFVTLAAFQTINTSMFELARAYAKEGMAAYTRLEAHESGEEPSQSISPVRVQEHAGISYFDEVQHTISGNHSSLAGSRDSKESPQFV